MEREEESFRWFKGAIFRFNFSLCLSYRQAPESWQCFQDRDHHQMSFAIVVSRGGIFLFFLKTREEAWKFKHKGLRCDI